MNTWKPPLPWHGTGFCPDFPIICSTSYGCCQNGRLSNKMLWWGANSRCVLCKPPPSPQDAPQLQHLLTPQSAAAWLLATAMALIPLSGQLYYRLLGTTFCDRETNFSALLCLTFIRPPQHILPFAFSRLACSAEHRGTICLKGRVITPWCKLQPLIDRCFLGCVTPAGPGCGTCPRCSPLPCSGGSSLAVAPLPPAPCKTPCRSLLPERSEPGQPAEAGCGVGSCTGDMEGASLTAAAPHVLAGGLPRSSLICAKGVGPWSDTQKGGRDKWLVLGFC